MIGDRVSLLVPITGPVNPFSQVITIHLEIDLLVRISQISLINMGIWSLK